ncbi:MULTISPECIES: hypothetical protein [unclassified Modicisalibacter]|uniref:hypothetical protein n=1 Tax=unclassified Modicisalibacter TaxID=2679913 RepID=UPI001CCF41E4|nr:MULTISPECIES: hypothetical protein [unclassified Modicisalibacter]MBZ9559384.1 hypothetical protein [Modicisalibacter sp. R2A 31.J]MBZ9576451.1 hypothetical protein [Modicisalibacter sp. MOD 31.J]
MSPAGRTSRHPRHGATRRRQPRRPAQGRSLGSADRWLDVLVTLSVVTALVTGLVALAVTLLK